MRALSPDVVQSNELLSIYIESNLATQILNGGFRTMDFYRSDWDLYMPQRVVLLKILCLWRNFMILSGNHTIAYFCMPVYIKCEHLTTIIFSFLWIASDKVIPFYRLRMVFLDMSKCQRSHWLLFMVYYNFATLSHLISSAFSFKIEPSFQ